MTTLRICAFLAAASLAAPCARPSAAATAAARDDGRVVFVKPLYLSPGDLSDVLGVRFLDGQAVLDVETGAGPRAVRIRRNDAANLLILSGAAADVAAAEELIASADAPPRQITVEATIVEVDRDRVRDLGIDWDDLVRSSFLSLRWDHIRANRTDDISRSRVYPPDTLSYTDFTDRQSQHVSDTEFHASASTELARNLHVLDQTGAGTIRDAPRIVTLNNRRATILDGQRVTYVSRYSSYANLFVTDSLDAGLTLSVLPSIGESGYLTLEVRAEMTQLTKEISGSPVKDGQMVENTVVVKDGESVLLGGFRRSTEQRVQRRLPVLGRLVPFLFSRSMTVRRTSETFIVLTPKVVDLASTIDERTRGAIEGR